MSPTASSSPPPPTTLPSLPPGLPPDFHINRTDAYYSDEEEQDQGFSEIETLALACFLTLLPLIFGVISYFGFKPIWLRLRRTVEASELSKSTKQRESTRRENSSHALLADQPSQSKTPDSEVCVGGSGVLPADVPSSSAETRRQLAPNGSLITMTMRDNHLIVETEERIPMSEEDKRKAEGQRPETALLEEVRVETPGDSTALVHVSSTSQEQQVQPNIGANTGLSTSDLSSSSEASTTNRGYRYGNQEEYRTDDDDFMRGEKRGQGVVGLPRPSLDLGRENLSFQAVSPPGGASPRTSDSEPPPANPGSPPHLTTDPGSPTVLTANPGSPAVLTTNPGSPAVFTANPGSPAVETANPGSPAVKTANPGSPAVKTANPGSPAVKTANPGSPPVKTSDSAASNVQPPSSARTAGLDPLSAVLTVPAESSAS